MKQKRNMCLLLGILVVLVVLYVGLNQWNRSKEEEQAKQEEQDTISLVDADELTGFQYTNGETTLSFVKEEDTWYLKDDKDTSLNQDSVEEIADAIKNLTATRELESPDALSDYGLEEPVYTVQYTADGETKTIYIGNTSDPAGEEYYATTEEKDKVYTIDSELVSSMSFNLTDFTEETEATDDGTEAEETED